MFTPVPAVIDHSWAWSAQFLSCCPAMGLELFAVMVAASQAPPVPVMLVVDSCMASFCYSPVPV